jgi:hypothetical protein
MATFEENFNNHKAYIQKYMLKKMNIDDLDNIKEEDKVRLTKEFILCLQSELAELLAELPWKHWKNYDKHEISSEKIKFEIIDLQHFVNDLYMIWNMNTKEINDCFETKLTENINRQENNY